MKKNKSMREVPATTSEEVHIGAVEGPSNSSELWLSETTWWTGEPKGADDGVG